MPIQILMPALSPTMTEGTLAKWAKAVGDTITSGDLLAEIETDKATMEIEAVDEGILGKILVAEGTEGVPVNQLIGLILEDGEDASALEAALAPVAAPAAPPAAAAPAPAAPAPAKTGNRIIASPLARRLATAKGVDLATVTGSGPKGRIVKRDVESAAPGAPAPKAEAPSPPPALGAPLSPMPDFEAVPHSSMRKTIARRLTESVRDIPHFNVSVDVQLGSLLDTRKRLNARDGAEQKISVNDFVIKAIALALARVPACNVSYTDEATLFHQRADISIAVSIDGGLITPIVKDAGNKSLAVIAREAKALAERARAGELQPDEYEGGTFTVSNMGMMGVRSFNSIINPPQGAILSVGAGEPRPVVTDGALSMATVMTLTLAVDHRCIDGVTAAEFIGELKSILEEPLQFML
ncbi:MAG: Dihydrolipoyllysine-residue acetyltransferase component of pyruvate dehydrogenase complex [Alphaproteobacteria bacterium MarineAlpha3_Bin2]|mgnify:CR=1 FL=1|jgi:pyruvate dehydrogenase E2 component (dihydrolipoamide acetyltransferase)|nr:MAG: Dihydrolipoyllysine-residue acetyltransferase component of pyruvate dehydrogenase complex [Alphaproteobacteria bacterium MarineAlpha3_Bin2]